MLSSKDEKSPNGFFLAKSTGSADGAGAAGAALTGAASAGFVTFDLEEAFGFELLFAFTEMFLAAFFASRIEAFLVLLTLDWERFVGF